MVDKTRFSFGDNCIIYHNTDSEDIDTTISNQIESLIKACVAIIDTTITETDTIFLDNLINNEVNHAPTRRYLTAYLRWIMLSTYKLTKADKNDIQKLPNTLKNRYSVFLARIASLNNSSISEREEKLKNILPLFGVDSKSIHTFIHRSLISSDEEFVTIEKGTNASEFTIGKVSTINRNGFTLSGERLAKVENQTRQAQDLLSDIFEDEETVTIARDNKDIMSVLSVLLSKESWQRNEVESICQKHHLTIGFVLEQINDYSYNKIEDAVIEDDGDTIYVMTEYKDKLI